MQETLFDIQNLEKPHMPCVQVKPIVRADLDKILIELKELNENCKNELIELSPIAYDLIKKPKHSPKQEYRIALKNTHLELLCKLDYSYIFKEIDKLYKLCELYNFEFPKHLEFDYKILRAMIKKGLIKP